MTTLRLRVLKRHTSLEVSFEEFLKAELYTRDGRPDMNLSVFDVESDCLVRTHAEYCVSLLQPAPKKKRGGLALQGCEADFDATQPVGRLRVRVRQDATPRAPLSP